MLPPLMVRAALFDMDGLLVDSEPFWRQAEMEVFATVGVHLDESMCEETMGLRIDEVVDHWHRRFPWRKPERAAIALAILDRMEELLRSAAEPLPGARRAVRACRDAGLATAVASSSPRRLIDAVVDRLGLRPDLDALISAETFEYGKPHPAVFLAAAAQLGVAAVDCLVFEDSLTGLVAAKAARMTAVGVPAPSQRGAPQWSLADHVLPTLEELDLPSLLVNPERGAG